MKSNLRRRVPRSFLLLVLLVSGTLHMCSGCTSFLSSEEQRIVTCEQIAQEYCKTHKYIPYDVFDCDNMACDIWNMLMAKGINAQIVIGNVEREAQITLENCNHAWVLAEISPNAWLAIECTDGRVVYKDENPLYYSGFFFANPKDYEDFKYCYKLYELQVQRVNDAVNRYNQLVIQYNNATYSEQLGLKNALLLARAAVEREKATLAEIKTQLDKLLK